MDFLNKISFPISLISILDKIAVLSLHKIKIGTEIIKINNEKYMILNILNENIRAVNLSAYINKELLIKDVLIQSNECKGIKIGSVHKYFHYKYPVLFELDHTSKFDIDLNDAIKRIVYIEIRMGKRSITKVTDLVECTPNIEDINNIGDKRHGTI